MYDVWKYTCFVYVTFVYPTTVYLPTALQKVGKVTSYLSGTVLLFRGRCYMPDTKFTALPVTHSYLWGVKFVQSINSAE
jgi:hypothetical protein